VNCDHIGEAGTCGIKFSLSGDLASNILLFDGLDCVGVGMPVDIGLRLLPSLESCRCWMCLASLSGLLLLLVVAFRIIISA